MIQPEEQRIMKMMEVLEETDLFTETELSLAEEYLQGNADRQALEQLEFRDMSGIPEAVISKCNGVFDQLAGRGGLEERNRLAQFLFAAGQSTCAGLLMPGRAYPHKIYDTFFPSEPEKQAAVYAPKAGQEALILSHPAISNLIRMADNDPENLRKALAYQKNKTFNGRLLLLGAYFVAKYPPAEQESASHMICKEDALLMKEYEDAIVGSLSQIYTSQALPAGWKEIEDAVNNDRLDHRILKTAETGAGVNQYMMRLLGGMSFLNFSLSLRLKNVVKVCFRADFDTMLKSVLAMDVRCDLAKRGGDFDEIFEFEPYRYIKWAAEKGVGEIAVLKEQCRRNRESFLEYMGKANFRIYNTLAAVMKEVDPEAYQAKMAAEASRQRVQVINAFVGMTETKICGDVRAYLEEKTDDIEIFYPYGESLLMSSDRQKIGKFWEMVDSYKEGCGYDALSNKCTALMMLCRGFGKYVYVFNYNYVKKEGVESLFAAADSVGLALKYQLDGYSDIANSYCLGPDGKKIYEAASREIFRKYLEDRREEMLAAIRETDSPGRSLGLKILSENPRENRAEILKFAQDTAKGVKEELLELLYRQKDWEQDIIAMLSSKKAADRDVAVRVLAKWDSGKYAPLFAEALEKEKNGKVRALLDNALNADGSGQSCERKISQEDLVREVHKGNKKRTLGWAYETPFSKVHKKSGEEASEEYLQAILLSYSAMSPCGISPSAATLAEALEEEELAVYMNELFDKWLEAGAESKKRWVLYASAIHGGNAIVEKMRHQIQEWPQAARGAIASEAVQALALNPKPQALLIVDGISRKFKFKQVKAAAGKALEFAASQLGITKEELADRIVPDLGFDEKMERCFDYGERKFTVTITPALETEVFDESGKKLKNLPAPGKRDDEARAAAAYEEFKQLKKQMKATVSSQKMRLEMALSTERRWRVAAWKDLFVKNPIMHQFAIGLIWGVYEDGKLTESFRYMEDGSFNTEDEEEFELPEEDGADPEGNYGTVQAESSGTGHSEEGVGTVQSENGKATQSENCSSTQQGNSSADQPKVNGTGQLGVHGMNKPENSDTDRSECSSSGYRDRKVPVIGLIHPIELSQESMENWRQQLEDYEIVQPIEQLDRSVYRRTKEEEQQRSLERFGGCIVNDLSLGGKLMGEGWYRGSVQDGGGFYTYYREDPELSLGAELHFSGGFIGGGNEDVTVYETRFYEAGTIKRGSYEYDEADDKNSYLLKDVPERYFSEVVRQIARATASGKDRNENWKTERR